MGYKGYDKGHKSINEIKNKFRKAKFLGPKSQPLINLSHWNKMVVHMQIWSNNQQKSFQVSYRKYQFSGKSSILTSIGERKKKPLEKFISTKLSSKPLKYDFTFFSFWSWYHAGNLWSNDCKICKWPKVLSFEHKQFGWEGKLHSTIFIASKLSRLRFVMTIGRYVPGIKQSFPCAGRKGNHILRGLETLPLIPRTFLSSERGRWRLEQARDGKIESHVHEFEWPSPWGPAVMLDEIRFMWFFCFCFWAISRFCSIIWLSGSSFDEKLGGEGSLEEKTTSKLLEAYPFVAAL